MKSFLFKDMTSRFRNSKITGYRIRTNKPRKVEAERQLPHQQLVFVLLHLVQCHCYELLKRLFGFLIQVLAKRHHKNAIKCQKQNDLNAKRNKHLNPSYTTIFFGIVFVCFHWSIFRTIKISYDS